MTAPHTATALHAAALTDMRIGHVHLRVADLERATAFYRDALGFRIVADGRAIGLPITFLAGGDYHHHIALNAQETADAGPPPPGHTGLHHFAILLPDRPALIEALRRLEAHGHSPVSAWDHGATVSIYVRDPDGNSVELYYDRPRDTWYDAQGRPVLKAERFDPAELLRG